MGLRQGDERTWRKRAYDAAPDDSVGFRLGLSCACSTRMAWSGGGQGGGAPTGGPRVTRGNLALPGTRTSGVLTTARRSAAGCYRAAAGRRAVVPAGDAGPMLLCGRQSAGAAILATVPAVAQIEGWPRVTSVALEDGRRQDCDLLVLATPLAPWLPAALAGAVELPGVFVAGSAAQGEVDAIEATAAGAAAGRLAAEWALHGRVMSFEC